MQAFAVRAFIEEAGEGGQYHADAGPLDAAARFQGRGHALDAEDEQNRRGQEGGTNQKSPMSMLILPSAWMV